MYKIQINKYGGSNVFLKNIAVVISVISILAPTLLFAEPTANEIKDAKSLIYKIPNDPAIIDIKAPLKGIKFSDTCRPYYQQGVKVPDIKGVTFKVENGELIVKDMNGSNTCDDKFRGAYKKYNIKIKTEVQADTIQLLLLPVKETIQEESTTSKIIGLGLFNHDTPAFSLKKLNDMLRGGAVGYVFELDSPYSPESVYANFKRLWKERRNGSSVRYNGKQYDKWFEYKLNEDNNIKCFVEIIPYRNGSKATMSIYLPLLDDDSNVIDVGKQINNVKTILTNVVNN